MCYNEKMTDFEGKADKNNRKTAFQPFFFAQTSNLGGPLANKTLLIMISCSRGRSCVSKGYKGCCPPDCGKHLK